MTEQPERHCGGCYWWSPLRIKDREFLGDCGHNTKPGGTTDKFDTCGEFEPAAAAEGYLS